MFVVRNCSSHGVYWRLATILVGELFTFMSIFTFVVFFTFVGATLPRYHSQLSH